MVCLGGGAEMSSISLPRSMSDLGGDDAADIPDIPMHRGQRNGATVFPDTVSTLTSVLPGIRSSKPGRGPISPKGIAYMQRSTTPGPAPGPLGRMVSPEPYDDSIMDTGTPYASTYQRSLLSARSKGVSIASTYLTSATSLAALQTKAADDDEALEPLAEEEIEPGSFDLVAPALGEAGLYSLERRSELLFSKEHLRKIFDDSILLQRFTTFLAAARPASLPLLIYYLDALKAMRALAYANAVVEALGPLDGHDFSKEQVAATANQSLATRAEAAFEALARDDMPAYITHVWIQTVSVSIKKRITGTLPPHLREMSEGLAEVFCLTDPSRHDNPIVFASEEFHRTTQYGMSYVLGRNCRFLQGPKTNPNSVKRLAEKIHAGKECFETFLNYRRDGSPFMNLLMVAPLYDSRGAVRYFIGAQVDVSGLAKDCVGLESLRRLVDEDEGLAMPNEERNASAAAVAAAAVANGNNTNGGATDDQTERTGSQGSGGSDRKTEIRELCEMFNLQEVETVRRHGGSMHRLQAEELLQVPEDLPPQQNWGKQRVLIQDEASSVGSAEHDDEPLSPTGIGGGHEHVASAASAIPHAAGGDGDGSSGSGCAPHLSGRLTGVYEHYLLVRPAPSLKILFASPSLRVPGILQSHFMSKIGGSARVRDELTAALSEGHGVTAKVRWVSSARNPGPGDGRHRWIHCTPLLGGNGAIGVWMVVITDDDGDGVGGGGGGPPRRLARDAPPVDPALGSRAAQVASRQSHRGGAAAAAAAAAHARKAALTGSLADVLMAGPPPPGVPAKSRARGDGESAISRRSGVSSQRSDPARPFHTAATTRSSSPYTLRIGDD
ncbi:hypothetical protein RB597_007462 [Gaeumannomyces tritici]